MSHVVQAAIPKGGPARPVHSKRSNAVALATRLATNVKVSADKPQAFICTSRRLNDSACQRPAPRLSKRTEHSLWEHS